MFGAMYAFGCVYLVTVLFFRAAFSDNYKTHINVNGYGERNIELVLVPIVFIISLYSLYWVIQHFRKQ